jgi:hypothetical protein
MLLTLQGSCCLQAIALALKVLQQNLVAILVVM